MKRTPYEVKIKAPPAAGGKVYTFKSADGVISKDKVRQSVLKLLDNIDLNADDRVLNMSCNYGVLGLILADKVFEDQIVLTDSNARAIKLAKINAKLNQIDNSKTELTPSLEEVELEPLDVVAYPPKPFEPIAIVKQNIIEGLRKLKTEGKFYLAAHKQSGGNRYYDFLEKLCSQVSILDKSEGYRVVKASKKEEIDYRQLFEEHHFKTTLRGITCSFDTRPGIFSPKSLDQGTKKLIEEMAVENGDKVLDVGCGYGAIGIFAAKIEDCKVYLTDNDAVATSYARKNAEANKIQPAKIITDDCLGSVKDKKFDKIMTNPPTHAGEDVIQEIFENSHSCLASDGSFYLVYNEILNYEEELRGLFDQVEIIRQEDKFKVVQACKNSY